MMIKKLNLMMAMMKTKCANKSRVLTILSNTKCANKSIVSTKFSSHKNSSLQILSTPLSKSWTKTWVLELEFDPPTFFSLKSQTKTKANLLQNPDPPHLATQTQTHYTHKHKSVSHLCSFSPTHLSPSHPLSFLHSLCFSLSTKLFNGGGG
ncbi:hypothetical protein ACB092_03G083200 [Castanea dentata]